MATAARANPSAGSEDDGLVRELSSFGRPLRQWRAFRGASQLRLATAARISPRHLSFLETGRSQPSRAMVLCPAEALDVPLRERNALLKILEPAAADAASAPAAGAGVRRIRSMLRFGRPRLTAIAFVALMGAGFGCWYRQREPAPVLNATPSVSSPERYRLAGSGSHWDVVGADRVVEDLLPRYPAFFEIVLDLNDTREPDLRPLRDDLERAPVNRRSFDALNAIAVAYFELNYRAQSDRGGSRYFADSFRAAKLLAVPWRAYGEVSDPALRDAILDFFEDAATGDKLAARETAGRLASIIESLEHKESDPLRRERIQRLLARIRPE